jgi:signal transduction histidine kinase
MDQISLQIGSSREAPAAPSVIDPSFANRPDLVERFDQENDRLFVGRLSFTLFLFLSFVAVIGVVEYLVRPGNGERLLRDFASLVGVSAIGLAVCTPQALHRVAKWIALPLISFFLGRLSADAMLLGSQAQHLAMWHVCILTGTAVLLPWGGSLQSCAAIVALASFSWALSSLVSPDGVIFPVLGLVTGATISIFGARFLHQYRRSTFFQTTMLQEEADVAAALGHVGQVLSVNLNRPDMLEKVNQVAVELTGCDWSGTFTWHDRPRGYRLSASFGLRPDARTELTMLEFPSEISPLLRALRPGQLVEMVNGHGGDLVPTDLRRRFDMGSVLFAPLYGGSELVGVLACAFREPRHRFHDRERRLALGIAHATAIAHQNAVLIRDLTAASRLKSDFVATMSHELRTPLNIIMGYTDLLSSGEFGDLGAPQREVLEATRRSAQQLFELVNATLDLNRMDAGRESVETAVVNIDDLFEEVASEVQPLVGPEVNLRCVNRLETRLIVIDRVKLKTIVKNLVGNALKFTDRGSVEIVAHGRNGQLSIEVRDTGIGIPEEKLPVIFEMFRQLDSSPTRRHDGVGLGLHIVKRLVDLLGGSILVASEVGVGTTFTVSLPLTSAEYRLAS